jgi:hypothetical protein
MVLLVSWSWAMIVSLGLPHFDGEIFVLSGIIFTLIGSLLMRLKHWEMEGLQAFGMIHG